MSNWILLTLSLVAFDPASQAADRAPDGDSIGFASHLTSIYSDDTAAREKAAAELRRAGPSSLESLLAERDRLIALYREVTDGDAAVSYNRKLAKLDDAIDQVAQQRYAGPSRLYWHTDLETAKAAAQAAKKPILSLRLLGKLTDDLSCANSRFFRTTLYPNREVSEYLRNHFILHWQTFREVPRVTIDFGNGKKIERTLTGNSIHCILDSAGRPIDALPGLYSPTDFVRGLKQGAQLNAALAQAPEAQRSRILIEAHTALADQSTRQWLRELQQVAPTAAATVSLSRLDEARQLLNVSMQARNQVNGPQSQAAPATATPVAAPNPPVVNPPAAAAAPLAVTKSRVEIPLLKGLALMQKLTTATSDEQWEKLAGLHRPTVKLDSESRKLIKKQQPLAPFHMRGQSLDAALEVMFDRLEREIAFDSTRNEYLFRNQIHDWFRKGEGDRTVDVLNARVYNELFLTSDKDPFAGLVSPESFTGIERGGFVERK